MAVLSSLKLVSAKRVHITDPVATRRIKLIQKLQDQLRLVQARQAGQKYMATRIKTVTDEATGERKTVEVAKRVREWFWVNEAGKFNMHIKYGQNVLYLNNKSATAIEVASMDELATVIQTLITATGDGELDKAIEAASDTTRKGFGK